MIRPVQETGKNLYDIRTDCQPNNPLCYGIIQDIETYMNLPHVQKIIGVDREFKGCNMDVNMKVYKIIFQPVCLLILVLNERRLDEAICP